MVEILEDEDNRIDVGQRYQNQIWWKKATQYPEVELLRNHSAEEATAPRVRNFDFDL